MYFDWCILCMQIAKSFLYSNATLTSYSNKRILFALGITPFLTIVLDLRAMQERSRLNCLKCRSRVILECFRNVRKGRKGWAGRASVLCAVIGSKYIIWWDEIYRIDNSQSRIMCLYAALLYTALYCRPLLLQGALDGYIDPPIQRLCVYLSAAWMLTLLRSIAQCMSLSSAPMLFSEPKGRQSFFAVMA